MKRRGDYGSKADPFFDSLEEPVGSLARELRGVIRKAVPGASESIKWGMPVYGGKGLVCAIRVSKEYVALQFYTAGTSLRDPAGLLEGTGKKMRHVKVRSKNDIRKTLFASWIKQAANGV